jgi:allantoate deiminase
MSVSIDAMGSLIGRRPGARPDARTLLIGSHIDTVRDAGIYDGNLGVVTGLAVIEALNRRGITLPFAIELVAFGDEEGVRFPSTLTGSRALAGRFEDRWLDECDADGIERRQALAAFGAPPDPLSCRRDPAAVIGFVEVHIEQGPVLEVRGLPVGIVTDIAGALRGGMTVRGVAGHSGTLPMALRHDALAAAAEIILALEARARAEPDLVATVGLLDIPGGAVNVVPGRVQLSFDIRSPHDDARQRAARDIRTLAAAIADRRGVAVDVAFGHMTEAAHCDQALSSRLARAVALNGIEPTFLPSGAGHDAASFHQVLPIAMLFVRCRDGVSHSPREFAAVEDIEIAARVLYDFLLDPDGF